SEVLGGELRVPAVAAEILRVRLNDADAAAVDLVGGVLHVLVRLPAVAERAGRDGDARHLLPGVARVEVVPRGAFLDRQARHVDARSVVVVVDRVAVDGHVRRTHGRAERADDERGASVDLGRAGDRAVVLARGAHGEAAHRGDVVRPGAADLERVDARVGRRA